MCLKEIPNAKIVSCYIQLYKTVLLSEVLPYDQSHSSGHSSVLSTAHAQEQNDPGGRAGK